MDTNMEKYDVIVAEYPAKNLVGLKVRTSMQRAAEDCPALWVTFGPRMEEIPAGDGVRGDFYGVSIMLNAEEFDYWAAVEAEAESAVPEGMACMEIPAGQYAKCTVPDLQKLGDALMYLYSEWPKSQREYVPDEEAPGFELYPANWQETSPFEVFAPLKRA